VDFLAQIEGEQLEFLYSEDNSDSDSSSGTSSCDTESSSGWSSSSSSDDSEMKEGMIVQLNLCRRLHLHLHHFYLHDFELGRMIMH
jgi:hypothetical protein